MKKSGVYQGDEDPSKTRERELKSKSKSKENKRKSKVKSKVVTESGDGKTKEKVKVVTNKKTGNVTTKKKKVTKGPEGRKKSTTKKTTNPQDEAFKRMIEASFKPSKGKEGDTENGAKPSKTKEKKNKMEGMSPSAYVSITNDKPPTKQSKPDYIDIDGDGDKKESMKKAAAESPAKKMNHSMAYKADYDKDMAEERIKIKDAKEDIYEDDKEKRDSMATKKSFAMQFSEKSPMARFKDFDQMDSYDAKETAGESPAKQKMFGSESLYKENKSYENAVKSYDDSTKAGYSPTYPKMSDHFHAIQPDKPKSKETMKKSPAPKHGAMKGDQSATRTDYANYKGTDKGYHGTDGSSHGDQSATKSDYRTRMTRNSK